MTDEDRQPVILDTGAPSDPEYVREVADAFAEAVRVLNHLTRHHEALKYPSEADRLIRVLATAASRLPQLCGQIGAWLAVEQEAGRVRVPSSSSLHAVTAARMRLEAAAAVASELQEALDSAARVTCDLAAAED